MNTVSRSRCVEASHSDAAGRGWAAVTEVTGWWCEAASGRMKAGGGRLLVKLGPGEPVCGSS